MSIIEFLGIVYALNLQVHNGRSALTLAESLAPVLFTASLCTDSSNTHLHTFLETCGISERWLVSSAGVDTINRFHDSVASVLVTDGYDRMHPPAQVAEAFAETQTHQPTALCDILAVSPEAARQDAILKVIEYGRLRKLDYKPALQKLCIEAQALPNRWTSVCSQSEEIYRNLSSADLSALLRIVDLGAQVKLDDYPKEAYLDATARIPAELDPVGHRICKETGAGCQRLPNAEVLDLYAKYKRALNAVEISGNKFQEIQVGPGTLNVPKQLLRRNMAAAEVDWPLVPRILNEMKKRGKKKPLLRKK